MDKQCRQDQEIPQWTCEALAKAIIRENQYQSNNLQNTGNRFGNADQLRHLNSRACGKGDLLDVIF